VATKNKFALFALPSALVAIFILFVSPYSGVFLAVFSIILGILGIRKYNQDPSVKGKTESIVAIVISGIPILILIVIVIIFFVTIASFSSTYTVDHPPKAYDVDAVEQGIKQVVDANNRFAFELYSELSKTDERNIFYSPYGIFSALGMSYEGARGQTSDEMKSVFHFPEVEVLRPNFAKIYNNLNEKSKEYELRTGNALWAQYDYPLLEDYTSRVEKYYGGKAANLDFKEEAEKSRRTINLFIEEQTNNRIKDLIPAGALNPMTRLIITNAIYFKGSWWREFDKSSTREWHFRIAPSGKRVKTPMMYMKEVSKARFYYADLEKLQMIELPYKGGKISMLVLLPKQGEYDNFETGESVFTDYKLEDIELSVEKLDEYKSQMQETKLGGISLPKFEFDTKYYMSDTLSKMGMPTAFTFPGADFSGMDGKENLYIGDVIHQAFIKVDEEGTEAAAATATIHFDTSVALPIFIADHPFIFIIQDRENGNILFMGRVNDPTQ